MRQIYLTDMHGLQFDLLDAYRRRLELDTRSTTKCFSPLRGLTAVHFVGNSFFGLSGFFRVQ